MQSSLRICATSVFCLAILATILPSHSCPRGTRSRSCATRLKESCRFITSARLETRMNTKYTGYARNSRWMNFSEMPWHSRKLNRLSGIIRYGNLPVVTATVANLDPSLFEPEKLLSLSISHLDEFSYLGFTETFEQDRERIFLHLGVPSHAEKFASNSTPGRPTAKDLPRSTLALLAHVTELDQILYAEAWARRAKKPVKHRKSMNNIPHILPERKISMPQNFACQRVRITP